MTSDALHGLRGPDWVGLSKRNLISHKKDVNYAKQQLFASFSTPQNDNKSRRILYFHMISILCRLKKPN